MYSLLISIIIMLSTWRDAEDAVHARDGYDYDGYRLRVEFPRGTGPSNYRSGGGRGSGSGGRGNNRGPPTRRTNHRVVVTGNSSICSNNCTRMNCVHNHNSIFLRTATIWKLARFKRSHERSWRCMLRWCVQGWHGCCRIYTLWWYEIRFAQIRWFQISITWSTTELNFHFFYESTSVFNWY